MLGEQETPVTPNSLSLTEAGRLALFSSSRPTITPRTITTSSKPVTKVQTYIMQKPPP